MPKIKDFLAALHNDFVSARVKADLQTVSLAKSYGNDDLLSRLDIPVPRIKIKDVQIEMDAFLNYSPVEPENLVLKNVSNVEIINFSKEYFSKKIVEFVKGDKQKKEIINVILKTQEITTNYANRYLTDELEKEIRIDKVTIYFINYFEDNILGVIKEYRIELDNMYKELKPSIINEFSFLEINKDDGVDIEFSNSPEMEGFTKVKIHFNLIDDDLIWEIDKKIASNVH